MKKKATKKKSPRKRKKTPRQMALELTLKKKEEFLATFRKTGNVTFAATQVGIARNTHYHCWMKDEKYAEAFASAREEAVDLLELEARRRAIAGVEEPVFYKGAVVGQIRKYSDVLLIFLLKGNRPEKYRDRTEITDPEGRNPLTGALEDLWGKIGRAAAAKQIPAVLPAVPVNGPIDGKQKG